jgi:hypothetical protein
MKDMQQTNPSSGSTIWRLTDGNTVQHVKGVNAGMRKTKEIQDYIKSLIINSGDNNSSSKISADSD